MFVYLINVGGIVMSLFERIMYKIYCSMSWNKYYLSGSIKRFVSKLACPHNAEEHFWHDGCVECSFDNRICPGCNVEYDYVLENYNGCCSRECNEHMINTFM